MGRIERNIFDRDLIEQKMIMEDTWCGSCDEVDLGLIEPKEFELDGKIYIEGSCKKCGNRVVSEITEKDVTP